jgi:drug/metabolite transporter (DMT)-like permease
MPIPTVFPASAAHASSPPAQAKRIVGACLGIAAAYAISRHLPFLPSTLLSSVALAVTSTFIGRIRTPLRWWALLGITCGAVLGTAAVLAAKLQQNEPQGDLPHRAILLGCFALAGCVAGRSLSRDAAGDGARHPRDLLRSASALTTGIFAVLVTLTFLHSGLDTARTFSSRLSTSLTILVATVSVPGWLTHLLDRPPAKAPRRRP